MDLDGIRRVVAQPMGRANDELEDRRPVRHDVDLQRDGAGRVDSLIGRAHHKHLGDMLALVHARRWRAPYDGLASHLSELKRDAVDPRAHLEWREAVERMHPTGELRAQRE